VLSDLSGLPSACQKSTNMLGTGNILVTIPNLCNQIRKNDPNKGLKEDKNCFAELYGILFGIGAPFRPPKFEKPPPAKVFLASIAGLSTVGQSYIRISMPLQPNPLRLVFLGAVLSNPFDPIVQLDI
jgi:hypothetical protein